MAEDLQVLAAARRELESGAESRARAGGSPAEVIYRSVWCWAHGCGEQAGAVLEAGATAASRYVEVAAALRRYFDDRGASTPTAGMYDQGAAAFAAYARGGGNVALYAQLAARLQAVYRSERPGRLLEVGPGDGQVVASSWPPELGAVDLVEPAAELLTDAVGALTAAGIEHHPHLMGIEEFLAGPLSPRRWPLAQATFSLQSLNHAARATVLGELAERCDRMLIAEFDVPARDDPFDPAWFLRCISRVEWGLAEYSDDRELVAQGFLVPMMLGFFSDTAPSNHEQPIQAWIDQLRDAGFVLVEAPTLLWDYWWAPAYLLHATPPTVRPGRR